MPLGPGVQGAADGAGHGGEERLGQALAGLAVGAGLGGARGLPPREAGGDGAGGGGAGGGGGDEAGDGGAAGVVGAEDLPEEDPQRDQRGVDPIEPDGDGGERRCNE